MILFHLKSAVRSFNRNKSVSLLNVVGLGIGLACCFLIVTFLQNEFRHDRHIPEAESLYRLINEDSLGSDINVSAVVLGQATLKLDEMVAPVVSTTRVHNRSALLSVGTEMFTEPQFVWTDPNFLETFGFSLAAGDDKTALASPGTIVISSELGTRLFGDQDPIGKSILVDNAIELTVTGVLNPLDSPSSIPTTAFASLLTLSDVQNPWDPRLQGWSFVKVTPGSNPKDVEALINENIAQIIPWLNMEKMYKRYRLQPVRDIRLHSANIVWAGNVSDIRKVILFSVIVALVLLLACVNFTNLATVSSLRRAKEVGLRKTIGAGRHQLISQFLIESVVLALVAFGVALVLVSLSIKWFSSVIDVELSINPLDQMPLYGWFLAITVLTGLLAGSYPAFYLSHFNPIRILKGGSPDGRSGKIRNGLVVAQFAISSMLIFASLVIVAQMHYIQNQNMGFDSEQVVSISSNGLQGDPQEFKQQLLRLSGVVSVTHASGAPFIGGFVSSSEWNGENVVVNRILADEDYLETMGIEMAEGRFYDASRPSEMSNAIVVNETFARKKGWAKPLEEQFPMGRDDEGNTKYGPVIGVMKDFKIGTAHDVIVPAMIDATANMAPYRQLFLVRLAGDSMEANISEIEALWKQNVTNRPLNLTFLDEQIASLHQSELRMSKLLNAFTVLALFIANLGVLGLASLAVSLRKKEVGIRKVLGASELGIVKLLSSSYVKMIGVALVFGLPLAWIAVEKWLTDFAYRITIGWEYVLLTVVLVSIPAFLIVASQALRSARNEPVDSLRYE